MRRPIKAHLINRSNRPVNRSNRPVNRSNRPVYRSKPVTHAILNLDLNSNRPVNRSNRPVYRYELVELSFLNLTDFYMFPAKPIRYTGTGPRQFDWIGRLIKPRQG